MISSLLKPTLLALLAVSAGMLAGCAPEKPSEAMLRDGPEGSRPGDDNQARPATEIEKEAVVIVDGEEVSLGEFNRRVQSLPEFARARFSTIEQKQSYLDSIAQFELMADVAEERGLGTRPEVLFALETALADRVVQEVVSERLSMDDIEQAAIERYYKEHRDEYQTPEARRVALIKVESADVAQRLREQVLEEMEKAEDSAVNAFRRAAAMHSVDRQAAKEGGDIGFVERPKTQSADSKLARQVFALGEIGQVTPVFEVDGGFALATFFEERAASEVSVEEASGEIRAKLYEQRKQQMAREWVAELKADATIETFDEVARRAKPAPEPTARRVEDIELRAVDGFGADKTENTESSTQAESDQ